MLKTKISNRHAKKLRKKQDRLYRKECLKEAEKDQLESLWYVSGYKVMSAFQHHEDTQTLYTQTKSMADLDQLVKAKTNLENIVEKHKNILPEKYKYEIR